MSRFITVTPIIWKTPSERKLGNPFLLNVDRIEVIHTKQDGMGKDYSVVCMIGARNDPMQVAEPYEDLVTAIAELGNQVRRR